MEYFPAGIDQTYGEAQARLATLAQRLYRDEGYEELIEPETFYSELAKLRLCTTPQQVIKVMETFLEKHINPVWKLGYGLKSQYRLGSLLVFKKPDTTEKQYVIFAREGASTAVLQHELRHWLDQVGSNKQIGPLYQLLIGGADLSRFAAESSLIGTVLVVAGDEVYKNAFKFYDKTPLLTENISTGLMVTFFLSVVAYNILYLAYTQTDEEKLANNGKSTL